MNFNNPYDFSQQNQNPGRSALQPLPPRSAFLLGRGPLPPPTGPEIATAAAMRGINHNHPVPPMGDENIDPRLCEAPQDVVAPRQVRVRIPIDNKVDRDIDFPVDITRRDFLDRVCAAMNLNPQTARLGWKTNDEAKGANAHELETDEHIKKAFNTIVDLQKRPRRQKEVYMIIKHLNPPAPQAAKKKGDGNRITDFAYGQELQMVKEKLRCAQHASPNRWCYINPQNPADHVALGYEAITLWARKIHDNDADPDCVTPPHCLRLDDLRQRASHARKAHTKTQPELPPIHIHINDASSLGGTSSRSEQSHSRKRSRSPSTDSGSDSDDFIGESLLVSVILEDMHHKVPKLNLPQYEGILTEQGIVYAKSVLDFDKDYYAALGMAEGAVGTFLDGVARAVKRDKMKTKKERKRVKEWRAGPSPEI